MTAPPGLLRWLLIALVVMGIGVAFLALQAEGAVDDLDHRLVTLDEIERAVDTDRRFDSASMFVSLTALGVGAFLVARIREASLRVPRVPAAVGCVGFALLWGTRSTAIVGGVLLAVAAALWLRWLKDTA